MRRKGEITFGGTCHGDVELVSANNQIRLYATGRGPLWPRAYQVLLEKEGSGYVSRDPHVTVVMEETRPGTYEGNWREDTWNNPFVIDLDE